jgi:hypothetical protein
VTISSYFGFLASTCELAGKVLFTKHSFWGPILGIGLMILGGFFWTAEALSQTPPEGVGYWENIKNKLTIRWSSPEITPTMKWAVAAGVLTFVTSALSMTAFFATTQVLFWPITVLSFGIGATWLMASQGKSTADHFNAGAAINHMLMVGITLAISFAPAVAILGTLATLASYISSALWITSYPAEAILKESDKQPEEHIKKSEPSPSYTNSLAVFQYPASPNGRKQTTFTAADCGRSRSNSMDFK